MSHSIAVHTDVLATETLSAQYIQALTQFAAQHYKFHNHFNFSQEILGINKTGEIAVFYDNAHKIIGFTRISCQHLQLDNQPVTIYSGGTYHDQKADLSFDAARFGLTRAIKYKLANPMREIFFFANADTPARYQFLANLSTTLYPKEGQAIPLRILKLVENLKKHNGWSSRTSHPMIIGEQMALRNLHATTEEKTPLVSYYLSLNPDYASGNSLLVYLPLNFADISQGIRHLLTQPSLA
ncbi:hypothetical protein [Legionella cardiaca]|uniref:Uncharacterized protein n=1 Tax=Legionella cardiaca TaxID=1071983 RepID=A0ABY8ATN7_9GAMM|nr:hypothetical protein [Legionella cardiaca]WED43134.1 hypothetical protein PXX05_14740 [Legionella cardiaca]